MIVRIVGLFIAFLLGMWVAHSFNGPLIDNSGNCYGDPPSAVCGGVQK